MTKDSDLQVLPSRRPIRECVGLIVNGTNSAAAIKAIVAPKVPVSSKSGWSSLLGT